ncbi:hypothetical protein ACH6CV_10775 [Bacillota bacterium Meth-B3]
MAQDFRMSKMQARDIAQAVDLWVEQYKRYCGGSRSFPRNWIKNTGAIEGHLSEKVEDGIAFALKSGDALFGYITYDEFPLSVCQQVLEEVLRSHALVRQKNDP